MAGEPSAEQLTLRVIGRFGIDGALPVPAPGGRAERLLKLLAANHDRTVSDSAAVDALWGDTPPTGALRNIAVLVSRLRRVLGRESIVNDTRGYRLVTGAAVTVDLAVAEALIAAADRELAANAYGLAALAAHRAEGLLAAGTPLAGEPDGEWVGRARAEVLRRLRTARAQRWTASLACGDLGSAIESAEAALRDDPLDEEAARGLMQAYRLSDLPGSALAVYEGVRGALADSLGIDPAEATQSLYLSILHSEPPSAGPAVGPSARPAHSVALVGRDVELADLLEPWSSALAGHGGLAAVVGATGIGKRTVLDAFCARVATAGALVLRTACLESERSLFLQPLVEAVRSVLLQQTPAAMRELLGEWSAPLAELIPEISQIMGPVRYEQYLPEAHHRRVLEAFAGFFGRLERQRPVLLVIDALEHAGTATLEALHFLGARMADHRVLVAVSIDAADSEQPLAVLGDTVRLVTLGPLGLDAVRELVARAHSRLDARQLLDLTGGSPLYLTELIRHEQDIDPGSDDGVPLPASLSAAITERLTAHGSEVIELLQYGAILGRTFALDDAARLGELRVEECARRAQRALQADLLVARRSMFAFANQILREVVYQSIPEPVRISRHARAAVLLANQPEAAAAQWFAAGELTQAIAAWRAAAEIAHRAFANDEARRLLTEAEQAARELGDPRSVAEVLLRRGQILGELGRYEQAHDDQQEALDIAGELFDDALEARALDQLGWTALYARDARTAADLAARSTGLAEAAAAAPHAPRSAWLLLGRVRHWDGDYDGAADAYAQALSERPDDEIAAQALTFQGSLLQHLDRFGEARRTLAEAIVLCRSNGLIRPLLQALFFTALARGDCGDFAGALRELSRARRLIDENGITYYSAGIDTTTSWLLRETGQLDRAVEIAMRAVEKAQRGDGALELEQGLHARLALGECYLAAGDEDAAAEQLALAAPYLNQELPYHARAHLRLLEMQARFDPSLAEPLLELARASRSAKYESLAWWHLGRPDEAAGLAESLESDQLLGQVGDPDASWGAILRLRATLPAADRETFMATGRLPVAWRERTGRQG